MSSWQGSELRSAICGELYGAKWSWKELGLRTVSGIGTGIDWTFAIPSGIDSLQNKQCLVSILLTEMVLSRLPRHFCSFCGAALQ